MGSSNRNFAAAITLYHMIIEASMAQPAPVVVKPVPDRASLILLPPEGRGRIARSRKAGKADADVA